MFYLIIGVAAIVYGIHAHHKRKTVPKSIAKLQESIQRNGEKMANNIYFIGYTVMPIIAGLLLILASLRGYSLN